MIGGAMARWRAASPRERALIAALLAVLGLAAAMAAMDAAANAREAAAISRQDLVEQQGVSALRVQSAAREAAFAKVEAVRGWAYAGATPTIAALALAADLEAMAGDAGLGDVRSEALGAPAGEAARPAVTVEIEGQFSWPAFDALLAAMARAEKSLTPIEAEVRDEGAGPRLRMVVMAPYFGAEDIP